MNGPIPDFWRQIGEGIALSFRRGPRFTYRPGPAGWFIFTGEPFLDFNCALVGLNGHTEDALSDALDGFRQEHTPFLVCIVDQTPELANHAARQGLTLAGPLPLMVYDRPDVPAARPVEGLSIRELASAEDARLDAALAEMCFSLPIQSIERVMPFEPDTHSGIRTLLAFRRGQLAGSVTMTFQKGGVGIWSLKTRPDLRRHGIGWHVMQSAIVAIRSRTDLPVFLVSTPQGKPLYDALGFQTLDTGNVWTTQS